LILHFGLNGKTQLGYLWLRKIQWFAERKSEYPPRSEGIGSSCFLLADHFLRFMNFAVDDQTLYIHTIGKVWGINGNLSPSGMIQPDLLIGDR
jgi:hypothetical protein